MPSENSKFTSYFSLKLLNAYHIYLRDSNPSSYLDLILSPTMFIIRQFGAWYTRCLENWLLGGQPTNPEISETLLLVDAIMSTLYMHRLLLACRFPHRIDPIHAIHAVQAIDDVLQAIRDGHGGSDPHDVLSLWHRKRVHLRLSDRKIFATPSEKMAMLEVWERWNDTDRLYEQFRGLIYADINYPYPYLVEGQVLPITECLVDWLQKRKAGQVYSAYPSTRADSRLYYSLSYKKYN